MKPLAFAATVLLVQVTWSSLVYQSETNTCTTYSNADTNSKLCTCTGVYTNRADWGVFCSDLKTIPSCPAKNQVLVPAQEPYTVDTGTSCSAGAGCDYFANNYTWTCCECPQGYIDYYQGTTCQKGALHGFFDCIACSDPNEVLVGDPTNGYNCTIASSSSSSTSTSTSSTTSSTVPPATSVACGSSNKRDLLTGRAEACNSCLDLTTLSDPALNGSQTIINTQFVDMVKGMISCATTNGFTQLYDASSSRCYRSKGKFAGTLPSAHLIGMAMDVNLIGGAHGNCKRKCFLEAYCVHNLNFNLCQPVLHTFSRRKPNAKDTAVYNFITCAGKIDGMVIGAKIPIPLDTKHPGVKQGDWDHFQGVPTGRYDTSLYDTYHPQLVQFCQGQCANAPLNHPSDEACPQPPKATCASHGIDFPG